MLMKYKYQLGRYASREAPSRTFIARYIHWSGLATRSLIIMHAAQPFTQFINVPCYLVDSYIHTYIRTHTHTNTHTHTHMHLVRRLL